MAPVVFNRRQPASFCLSELRREATDRKSVV